MKIGTYKSGSVYHGDCLELMGKIRTGAFDLVLTDPPYGVGVDYGKHKDEASEHWDWFAPRFEEMRRVGKAVVFSHRWRALFHLPEPDWVCIWNKPMSYAHRVGKWLPHWEPLFVYGTPSNFSPDVFSVNTARPIEKGHPCPKPVELMVKVLTAFSPRTVLDPFAGSGTTGVACVVRKCAFVGFELEDAFCKLANERLEAARHGLSLDEFRRGQKTLFEA